MQAFRRALRARGSALRALVLASNTLQLTESSIPKGAETLGARLRARPWTHSHESGDWRVAALAVSAVLMPAFCEALESDAGESDRMSMYFDAEYEPKTLLGCGTFGVVMQCVHKQTGRVAAVKMVQDLPGNQEEVEREKDALERLEQAGGHENIVGYAGSYYHNDFHYIVLEYVPGISLHSFMEKHHTLESSWALKLVAQLASALNFMHEADIIHRDLKPENIMALVDCDDKNNSALNARGDAGENEDVTLKIIDLGSAGRISLPESSEKARPTTLSGTRCYWPPEVLQRQDMTAAMDMWALGCILYILVSGRHPFDLTGCSTEEQIMHRITTEPVSFLLPVWHDVPAETKELIQGLLEKDPRRRLSADQVLEHPAIIEATKSM